MTTDGPAAKRPPHCGLAATCVVRAVSWRLVHGRTSQVALITRRSGAGGGRDPSRRPDRAQTARARNCTTWRGLKPHRSAGAAPTASSWPPTGRAPSPGGIPRPRHGDQPVGHLVRAVRRGDAVAGGAVAGPGAARHRGAAAVIRSRRGGGGAGVLSGARDHRAAGAARSQRRGSACLARAGHSDQPDHRSEGRERARLEGAADWSTRAAAAMVRKLAMAP